MGIVRIEHNKTNPYVMLNKKALEDKGLSWGAKGLWAYLLSKPDHWKVSVAHLSKIYEKKGGGEKSIYSLLNELIENGYCIRKQERGSDGLFSDTEYIILEFKKCLPDILQGDAVQSGPVEGAYSNKGDLEKNESSSKEEIPKKEKKDDDDLVFSDQEREDLNNYSEQEVSEALRITKECCTQSKNSSMVKFFFTTIKNLKQSPKKVKIPPIEELKKYFKHGEFYNQAECYVNDTHIGFSRGMRHESIDFKYFKWENFLKMCEGFGIEFKR